MKRHPENSASAFQLRRFNYDLKKLCIRCTNNYTKLYRFKGMSANTHSNDVPEDQELFPISVVSEATGVPAVTLRAWERRYGFLNPHRTETGRRLYSVEHIGLIRRVLGLLDSGVSVGRVEAILRGEGQGTTAVGETAWERYRANMAEAIQSFDERRLDGIYNEALAYYSIELVTRELIIPILGQLGDTWNNKTTGIAEEHFFSLYIRNKLGSRWHHGEPPASGRRVLACCLPGDLHEYGLMLFALSARSRGLDLTLLGANMPLESLPEVVTRIRAAAVVLSSTVEPGWQVIERDIRSLVSGMSVPVFVGGAGVAQKSAALEAVGAVPVGSQLSAGVEAIFSYLAEHKARPSRGDSGH